VAACVDVGGIDVNAEVKKEAVPALPASGGGRVPKPGDMRTVPCAPPAASTESPRIFDGQSGTASDCYLWDVTCASATRATGTPMEGFLQQELGADGRWRAQFGACRTTGPPQVDAGVVRDAARRLVPAAGVGTAPVDGTLVNVQTVMWAKAPVVLDLGPVSLLGQSVGIHLRLQAVSWDFGDGETEMTAGPGKPYAKGTNCRTVACPGFYGHTYTSTGGMRILARTVWAASFSVNGAGVVPIPGTVTAPAGAQDIEVLQARGVLVADPGPDR
jgi:hypothetical protein